MKTDDINVWRAFGAVAKQGHFSRAAIVLNVPLPQVSKRVSKLEAQLGVRLFYRTTRSVTLTDEGKALLPKVERILEDLGEVESYFEKKQNLSGTIKVTSVPFVAHRLLLPSLNKFMQQYPHLKIELELSESFVNMAEAGFDVALRIDTPKDSDLVYRKLVPNELVFSAAPDYLKKNKSQLEKPQDLKEHSLLVLGIHNRCKFMKSDIKLGDFKDAKLIHCENGAFLTDMALAGMGVLVRSIWDIQGHLKNRKLVRLLERHPLETFGHIYAVVPSRRYVAPRVRAFLDFIVNESKKWNY